MAKTYGADLRGRVIAAVEGGLSRRAAAERFQVAISTAIKWVRAWREHGRGVAKAKGGDTRSHRIEAHRAAILATIEAHQDITLAELAAMLAREHGTRVAPSTVHRFLVRHRITLKKRRRTPPSRSAPTWPGVGKPGSPRSPTSTPSG
jgi:transposase